MKDGSVSIGIDLDTKSFDAEIVKTESDLKEMVDKYNRLQEISSKGVKISTKQMEELAVKIQKTTNHLIDLKEKRDALNEDDDEPQKKINLLEKLTSGAKKLAFGILGIRTAYTVIRRMSSAYLSTDEHTTQQLSANWTALGTLMESVIKYISSIMKKLVTSVLYFASTLTGVNYIEKANTAILKNQTKATQGLVNANNKLTASFDEIETLGDDSVGGASSGIDATTLFDVADIGERAKGVIEKIATALQPVYEILKNIIDYSLEHPDVLLGVIGGALLLKTLASVIGIAGSGAVAGTGLAGIASMLGYIAGIGAIAIEISVIYNTVKEARDATENLTNEIDKWEQSLTNLNKTRTKVIESGKTDPTWIKNTTNAIKDENKKLSDNTKEIIENRKNMSWLEKVMSHVSGEWDADTRQIDANKTAMKSNIDVWTLMYEKGLLNEQQLKDYRKVLSDYEGNLKTLASSEETRLGTIADETERQKKLKDELNNVKEKLKELNEQKKINNDTTQTSTNKTKDLTTGYLKLKDKLSEMTRQVNDYNTSLGKVRKEVTTKFNMDTSSAKSSLNTLFSGIKGKLMKSLGIVFPSIKLAKGGIVNQPGRGVSYGGASIGEQRPEGIIPLSDAQQMSMIGEAIGKFVNINATVPVYVGNRLVAREMKRISAEDDFASNR